MLQYGGVPYHLNKFCKHTKALHLGCLYFLPCTFQNMPLVLVPTGKCRLILHALSKRVSNISENLNSKSKSFSCLEPQTWNQFFCSLTARVPYYTHHQRRILGTRNECISWSFFKCLFLAEQTAYFLDFLTIYQRWPIAMMSYDSLDDAGRWACR